MIKIDTFEQLVKLAVKDDRIALKIETASDRSNCLYRIAYPCTAKQFLANSGVVIAHYLECGVYYQEPPKYQWLYRTKKGDNDMKWFLTFEFFDLETWQEMLENDGAYIIEYKKLEVK